MDTLQIGRSELSGSRLVYGCMRLTGDGSSDARKQGKRAVHAALDAGYTVFDHADIYGHGDCESLFGELLAESPGLRDQLLVQTKCGVRFAEDSLPGRYNLSGDYIERSVDASLGRLGIEQIDVFLLHRPDYLMDAEDIARALERLRASGKVRHFGVSNFSPSQVELIQAALGEAPIVNQVEINLHTTNCLTDGTLDQCQRLGITPQAWSPLAGFAFPAWHNRFTPEQADCVRNAVENQAERHDVEAWLIPIAWLLRHPAKVSPVIGSTNEGRITLAPTAMNIDYSRADWYQLLEARNGAPVP